MQPIKLAITLLTLFWITHSWSGEKKILGPSHWMVSHLAFSMWIELTLYFSGNLNIDGK